MFGTLMEELLAFDSRWLGGTTAQASTPFLSAGVCTICKQSLCSCERCNIIDVLDSFKLVGHREW
jgi:hypothetical protein